jgi:hypothetical protein
MSVTLATWLVRLGSAYFLLGLLFAVPFVTRWAGRLDPVAREATRGFRVLVFPGSVALWPILAFRLLRGDTAPPIEPSTHILASRKQFR